VVLSILFTENFERNNRNELRVWKDGNIRDIWNNYKKEEESWFYILL
jgi:hypothetical protein